MGDSVYVQAIQADQHLPDLIRHLPMPLLDEGVHPRLWIGNSVLTQTHFDESVNIACHVAGDKVFTLFPPEQVANLYPGPLDLTPAGVPVSMVDLDAQDFERFPSSTRRWAMPRRRGWSRATPCSSRRCGGITSAPPVR